LYQLRLKLAPIGKKFDDIAEQLTKLKARAAERPDVTQKLEVFAQTLMKFGPPHPRPGAPPSLFVLESTTRLFNEIESADAAPIAAVKAAVADLETKVGPMMDAWHKLLESDLPALNQQLKQAGFLEIETEVEQLSRWAVIEAESVFTFDTQVSSGHLLGLTVWASGCGCKAPQSSTFAKATAWQAATWMVQTRAGGG